MKSFYDEYFRIPQEGSGKITDKVMLVKVAQIVATMVFCLLAMSLSAYAYFSHNVTSGTNVIQSADFGLNVTVTESETDISAGEGGIYQLDNGTYTVTLTKKGTASTGFGVIEVTVGETTAKYHTQQLNNINSTLIIDLTVAGFTDGELAKIKITPHWGTSSYYSYENKDENPYYIQAGEPVTISPTSSVNLDPDDNVDDEEETTPFDGTIDEGAGTDSSDDSTNEVTGSDSTEESTDESQAGTDSTEPTDSTQPTEIVHIVTKTDTLTSISKTYGVSIERIAIYNNIANRNVIETGQRIVIPPNDWVIPDNQ